MNDALGKTLASFSKELESRNLRYALIGGLAASIRGRVRATDDVVLIVLCGLSEALDLVASLRQTEFLPLLENYEEVAKSALLIPLIHKTTKVQLDLAIGLSGLSAR